MTPTPRSTRLAATLIATLTLGIFLLRLYRADFSYISWSDRDLWRASRLWVDFPTAGAELNYGSGARIPGGFSYLVMWLGLVPRGEPVDVFRLLLLMEGAGALSVAWVAHRLRGPLAAALAASLFLAPSGSRQALLWLWNPSAVPAFIGIGCALVAWICYRGGRAPWAAWAAALALGAQFHLTIASWMVWTGLALLVLGPRERVRHLPLVAGVIALVQLPYLLSEVLHGFPNTRLLLEQGPVQALTAGGGMPLQLDELRRSIEMVLPGVPDLHGLAQTSSLLVGILLGLAGLFAASRTILSERSPGRDTLLVLAFATTAILWTPALSESIHVEWRYLLAALPGLALLMAVGLSDLIHAPGASPRRGHAAVLAAVCALAAYPSAVQLYRDVSDPQERGTLFTWDGQKAWTSELRERTGWSLQEVAGRTGIARWDHQLERYSWLANTPIDLALHQEGSRFDGSKTPPCAIAVNVEYGRPPHIETILPDLLSRPAEEVHILQHFQPGQGVALWVYDLPDGHCPTTLVDRYVWMESDHTLFPLWEALPPGEVAALDAPSGSLRRAVMLAPEGTERSRDGHTLLGVWMTPRPGGVDVEIHSPQLKGPVFNGGWYQPGMVDHVDLILKETTTGESASHRLVERPLGRTFVSTPLRDLTVEVPSGRYTVSLRARIYPNLRDGRVWPPTPDGAPTPREVTLVDELVVP